MPAHDAADRRIDASDEVNRLSRYTVGLTDGTPKCGHERLSWKFLAAFDGLNGGWARAMRVLHEIESDC
jgi:hypothetical protein